MIYYIVVGICIFLLLAVVYISAKPISMGIEARRNIKEKKIEGDLEDNENIVNNGNDTNHTKKSVTDEIIKLKKLKDDGDLTEEEYNKAKKKLLS
tara:strand:+ start:1011 stop:1295 length:285 start_codon:yes stop_codon:yes gene_type:complete